jgi:hypothetical protein
MPMMLLDYGKPNPFGETLGKKRNLAWPVHVYRVTLPKVSEDGESLNAFERVILKLIDVGSLSEAEALARETCIPKDLVQCVLLRLRDKSYIDQYNQIITKQRAKWANQEEDQPVFVTALLFRELTSGKILPNIHLLKDDNPLKKKEEEERRFRRLRWDDAHRRSQPTPRDVISALRGMQKRSRAFGNDIRMPSVELITVAEDAELYYLDCPIAIQKSDGEFRIADPFGTGCSLVLEDAFSRLLEKDSSLGDWLTNWKRDLSNKEPVKQATAHREPFDNDANLARYPKLVANLRLGLYRQHRSIEKIHAAIEWALFYSCAQRPSASAVHQLKLANQSEHPALLQKAAEDISLMLPLDGLRPVREGKLDDFLSGKAELGTVLSLSLLMAARDASHPLRRIASAHQDFIIRLFKIKKDRDEIGHGAVKVRQKDIELPEEAFMREVVSALLPSVRFSDTPVAEVNQEAVADSLLDARTSIQNEFGFAWFNRLGTNLQDRLIAAERFWLSCNDGDDALAFACDVYAALQSTFRRSLSGALPPDIKDAEYSDRAQKNADACGLGHLPECLCTVKRSAICSTLQGNDQTLQSCVVAFLLISDFDTLSAIAHTHPPLIADVAHVVERRGHGNEPLPLPKDDIRKLRKAAFGSIKTLLEA